MSAFWFCFVSLFVAVDAIGILPMFLGLTEGADKRQLKRILFQSMLTGLAAAVSFLFLGQWLFRALSITTADFMVAGGILLFVISLNDLLSGEKRQRRVDPQHIGPVPIGVPLMVGPATLTTVILLADQHGYIPTLTAVVINIAIAGAVFFSSRVINRVIGRSGTRTVSKIASLILSAIAVSMVRRGVTEFFL